MKMKILRLRNSFLWVLLILAASSCGKMNCIDMGLSDHYSGITKEWVVNDTIGDAFLVDDKGNGQMLSVVSRDSTVIKDAFSDDCGNYFDDYKFSIVYKTSKSPFEFDVNIKGECITNYSKEDRFTIKLSVTNTEFPENPKSVSAVYDIVSGRVTPDDALITKHDKLTIKEKTYEGVLEFDFSEMYSDTGIKTVFYAKGYGIVKFVDESGNSFVIL